MLAILYLAILISGLISIVLGLRRYRRSMSPVSPTPRDASAQILRLLPIAGGIGAAVFGLVGLLLLWLTAVDPGLSVIWALGAGLLVGFAAQAILAYHVLREV